MTQDGDNVTILSEGNPLDDIIPALRHMLRHMRHSTIRFKSRFIGVKVYNIGKIYPHNL